MRHRERATIEPADGKRPDTSLLTFHHRWGSDALQMGRLWVGKVLEPGKATSMVTYEGRCATLADIPARRECYELEIGDHQGGQP